MLAVLHQNDRPVAQQMRTGLLYLELLVLGKHVSIFLLSFKAHNLLLFFPIGPGRYLFQDQTDHGYRTFLDRQPPTLTARVDRVLAVLHQNNRPVAQKMRTGLLYLELFVFGKIIPNSFVII